MPVHMTSFELAHAVDICAVSLSSRLGIRMGWYGANLLVVLIALAFPPYGGMKKQVSIARRFRVGGACCP